MSLWIGNVGEASKGTYLVTTSSRSSRAVGADAVRCGNRLERIIARLARGELSSQTKIQLLFSF